MKKASWAFLFTVVALFGYVEPSNGAGAYLCHECPILASECSREADEALSACEEEANNWRDNCIANPTHTGCNGGEVEAEYELMLDDCLFDWIEADERCMLLESNCEATCIECEEEEET